VEKTIKDAIRNSRYVIALLSSNSVEKRGYVQRELKEALEVLDEFPESKIFVIPVRINDCKVTDEKLRELQIVDLFTDWKDGIERILKSIRSENKKLENGVNQESSRDEDIVYPDPYPDKLKEIESKILSPLYQKWFEDHIAGLRPILGSDEDPNKVTQTVEELENSNLIERTSNGFYRITIHGIHIYEQLLSASAGSTKKEERKAILIVLKDLYEHNTNDLMDSQMLCEKLDNTNFPDLSAKVEILYSEGLVNRERATGHRFWVRLTAKGYRSLQPNP
jgi:hypothetical protein